MRHNKIKTSFQSFFRLLPIGVVFFILLSFSAVVMLKPGHASADSSSTKPLCTIIIINADGTISDGHTVLDCSASSPPDLAKGGPYSDSKCYTVTEADNQPGNPVNAQEADCSKPPFSDFCKFITGKACFANTAINCTPQDPNNQQAGVPCKEDPAANGCITGGDTQNGCGLVDKYIQPVIYFLAGAIGLIVTINIIIGGIQYSSAAGDPQKVADARKRIANSVLALVAFGLLYAVLQWLIPGGVPQ